MTALPYTDKIERSAELSLKFAETRSSLGDSYEQVAPVGINNVKEEWSISWILTLSEMQSLLSTIQTNGTHGIYTWTPPFDTVEKKFRLVQDSFARTTINNSVFRVTAKLRQCFDI